MSQKLTLDHNTGKLHCSDPETLVTYNDPWPCPSGTAGVTGQMDGVVMHTMAGYLAGAIQVFNNPANKASAHIGITQKGRIHQFLPIGKGYEAWHAFEANLRWYGIETEDYGHPENPISDAALTAWAQCFEFLSRFAGFPLQVTNDCHGKGLAYHRMCDDWNRSVHSCPGASFSDFTRVNQRAEIVHRAKLIRDPAPAAPAEPFLWIADGHTAARHLAREHGVAFDDCIWWTAQKSPQGFGPIIGPYIRAGQFDIAIPKGARVWVGKHPQ